MSHRTGWSIGWGILALLAVAAGPRAGRAAADAPLDFARDLEPLFKQQCVLCHNAALAQAGLRLDTREMALKGGSRGRRSFPVTGRPA